MVDTPSLTTIDTSATNGSAPRRQLPEFVVMTGAALRQMPSPGTQRALKAETGRDYMALAGPKADSADRTQTQIWQELRKTIPDLRWEECEDVILQIVDDDDVAVDPTSLGGSVISPASADSGV